MWGLTQVSSSVGGRRWKLRSLGSKVSMLALKWLTFRGEKCLHGLLLGDSHVVTFHPRTDYEKGPQTPAF